MFIYYVLFIFIMIYKKDVKDIVGKATLDLGTILYTEEFNDIIEDDSEWEDINELKAFIEEYLFDNIEQTLKNLLENGLSNLDSYIDYEIDVALNG